MPPKSKRILFDGLLLLAFIFIWALPLFKPRGNLGWGHYRFLDIYAGIPIALLGFVRIATALAPAPVKKGVALRLTAAMGSALIALVALDASVTLLRSARWSYWFDHIQIPRSANRPDAELGWVRMPHWNWKGRLAPNAPEVEYHYDENGFRNPPGLTSADVVLIGDSFTEAMGVGDADAFGAKAAKRTGLRIANLGRTGIGPEQERIILEKFGFRLHPKAVVWQIYEGNDLKDEEEFLRWKRDPEGQAREERPHGPAATYISLSPIAKIIDLTAADAEKPAWVTQTDGSRRPFTINRADRYRPELPKEQPEGLREAERTLKKGFEVCKSRGIEMAVVFVPVRMRVLGPYITFGDAADRERLLPKGVTEAKGDFGSVLGEFCRSAGIPFIDLYGPLKDAAVKDRSVYMYYDLHLDVSGNEVAAREIAGWLKGRAAFRGHA